MIIFSNFSSLDRVIVEAAPNDKIWGIGLEASDSRAWNRATWDGTNLLGRVLMRVRDRLKVVTAPDVTLIGIAGVTRSGKTSLASELARLLGISEQYIIHQDKSWKPPKDRPWNAQFKKGDMECPDAVDWNRLKGWISDRVNQARVAKVKYVIVEGFLLFAEPSVKALFHKKIFVSVPKDVAYKRRVATKFVKEAEFNELIWPSFLKYNAHVVDMDDVLVCDGCAEVRVSAKESLQFVEGKDVTSHKELLRDVFSEERRRRHRSRTPPRKRDKRSRSRSRSRSPSRERKRKDQRRDLIPLDLFKKLNNKGRDKRVVLVTCGAYCPPHKLHFLVMEQAKEYLERKCGFKVVGGFMSPSHDAYLAKKLRREDRIPAEDRLRMIEAETKSSTWIRSSAWESSQDRFVGTVNNVVILLFFCFNIYA